jgi:hypothetical protein
MTLQVVAGFLGQAGLQHPANLYRNLVGAIGGKRSGAFRYDDFALTPSAGAMSLTVGPGDAVLMGTEAVTTQGAYYVWNNANEVLAWPASTSLPRIDSLILRVIDTDYGSDPAGSKATWEIVSGTPNASPVQVADSAFAPAGLYYHPGAWLRVANFQVPASSTNLAAATLTHFRRYARVGRHTMGLSTAFPSDAQLGDQFTVLDGSLAGALYLYQNGAWTLSAAQRRSFTPTLTATTTNPTIGTGSTRNGWYSIGPGPTCTYSFFVRMGTSGFAAGSGSYKISLPITAADANLGAFPAHGVCLLNDNSAGASSDGTCWIPAGDLSNLQFITGSNTVNNTTPWGWANSDYITGSITYPI